MDTGTQTRFGCEGIQRFPGVVGGGLGEPDRAGKFAEFARRHHQSLVRFFTQRLGSREEARDLVQCAYVKVLTVDLLGRIANSDGDVWRCALTLATDWGRHRAVQAHFAQYVVDASVDPGRSIGIELEARRRHCEGLRSALAKMPESLCASHARVPALRRGGSSHGH